MSLSRGNSIAVVDEYLDAVRKSDAGRIVASFARDDASVEDPIGSEPKRGDAIREFYSRPRDISLLERVGDVAVSGSYVGFTFLIAIKRPDGMINVFIHETFRLDDEGKIVTMVAIPDFELGDELIAARNRDIP